MDRTRPVPAQRRLFFVATPAVLLLILVLAVILAGAAPAPLRETASTVGLVVAAVFAAFAGLWRARQTTGRRRRTWATMTAAAVLGLASNMWVASVGDDPLRLIGDLGVATALLLTIYALLNFPTVRRRGVDLAVMALDGLVVGGAALVVASVLVYPELLDAPAGALADRATTLLFPVLDLVLVTVAVLLVLRGGGSDRPVFALAAAGFLTYAVTDLVFAVRDAQGAYAYGNLLDLGWIAGYLVAGLAPCYPSVIPDGPAPRAHDGLTGAGRSAVVFGILMASGVVGMLGGDGGLAPAQVALWVVLILAVGTRQVLLAADNAALRRGLERRVREQTADLQRLARRMEVLLTSVGDGIYGVDNEGRITFVNPSGAAALGRTPDELLGRHAHDLFHAPDDDGLPYPRETCYVTEAIRSGLVAHAEEDTYVRPAGESFPVEITASPLVDEGQHAGAVVVFRDVTHRREIDRMKNEFLSVVSHELRTPLTSIRGSLGLLAGGALGDLDPRARSMVQIAVQSSDRLTRLINDLLDMERIESGSRPVELAVVDAARLVEAAVHQIDGLATEAGVRVVVGECDGRVLADEDWIMQTLTNLLGNAIKFSEPGGLVVGGARQQDGQVVIQVRDEGRGIPADKLESIFERFEQVDSSDARQKGGTGLGLAISRSIVERHGGRIWAESELGVGTTISFTLPAASPRPAAPVDEDPEAPYILVCDDDEDVVEVFLAYLRRHGFRAVGVSDGDAALERVRSERPAAVLLDLMMPGTSGVQVLRALKADPVTSDVPVVVISGLAPEIGSGLAAQADDWLVKPVSEGRLVTAVTLAVAGSGESVLLVEDDQALGALLSTLLEEQGLIVVHASSATEAIELGGALRPVVVVLDLGLPDGDGSALVRAFREREDLAHTPLVVYTAAEVGRQRRLDLELGETVFLGKERNGPEEVRDRVLELVSAVARSTASEVARR